MNILQKRVNKMIGELYLIRHAKAEDRNLGKPDFERKLTEKGIKQFTDYVPEIIPVLEKNKNLKIWTSPIIRAKETAQILTEAMGIEQAEIKEFLATGDLDELLQELQAEPDEFAVVCVGHEPSMSYWTGKLTDAELYFPKGGFVQIAFDGENNSGEFVLKMAPKNAKGWG